MPRSAAPCAPAAPRSTRRAPTTTANAPAARARRAAKKRIPRQTPPDPAASASSPRSTARRRPARYLRFSRPPISAARRTGHIRGVRLYIRTLQPVTIASMADWRARRRRIRGHCRLACACHRPLLLPPSRTLHILPHRSSTPVKGVQQHPGPARMSSAVSAGGRPYPATLCADMSRLCWRISDWTAPVSR